MDHRSTFLAGRHKTKQIASKMISIKLKKNVVYPKWRVVGDEVFTDIFIISDFVCSSDDLSPLLTFVFLCDAQVMLPCRWLHNSLN